MKRIVLQELFCRKISMEIKRFKKKMMKRRPNRIIANAYKIHCMLSIYEMLLEKSQELDKESLKLFLTIPEILALFYAVWLDRKDSFLNELEICIQDETRELQGMTQKLEIVL